MGGKRKKKESWINFLSSCGRWGEIGMEDGVGRWWSVWERKERRKKVGVTFFLLVEGGGEIGMEDGVGR